MIEKILVPIDSIEWDNTLNAVESALDLSSGCSVEGEPELIFLHVLNVEPRISLSERERIIEMKKKKMGEEFDTIKEICEERNLENFRTLYSEGNPVKEIIKTADEEDADIIIMGSGKLHDRSAGGRLQKFFYGSVTEKVIHEAPCSVLVARP